MISKSLRAPFSARLVLMTWLAASVVPASGDPGGRALLVLGDSLSAAHNIPVESGWVSLLDQRLAANGCDIEVINASISGETSAGGLSRLPDLLAAHQPAIVIIELGGNDGLRGLPVAALESNLRRMIELSRQAGAQVVLAGIRIPTNYGPRYARAFEAVYPDLAETLQTGLVPFILEGIASDDEAMQADRIHPRASAQGAIVENIWPQVVPLLGGCLVPVQ